MNETSVIQFPGLGFEINPPQTVFADGAYNLRWYGVIIAVGVLLAMVYALCRTKKFGFSRDDLADFLIAAIPLGIVGARLYYVLFRDAAHYLANPIEMLYVWNGGLAIYGGIIGGMLAVVLVAAIKRIKPLAVLDLAAVALPLAQAVGRWGNLINREAYGSPTALPWRMVLNKNGEWFTAHPCFLYESLWNLVGFVLLHFLSKKRKFDGQIFLLYIAWYGLGRALIEGLRTDFLGTSTFKINLIVAAVSCIVATALFVLFTFFKKPDPRKMQVERFDSAQAHKQLEHAAKAAAEHKATDDYDDDALLEVEYEQSPGGADAVALDDMVVDVSADDAATNSISIGEILADEMDISDEEGNI